MIEQHEYPHRAPTSKQFVREITILIAHNSLSVVHARCNEIQHALERVDDRASFKPGVERLTFHGMMVR